MRIPDPDDDAAYKERLDKILVGGAKPLQRPIEIRDTTRNGPLCTNEKRSGYADCSAIGLRVKHAGSTSVPGLPAKPIIDMVLEVLDSSDEAAYVLDLEAAGYLLTIREPDWYEHRQLKGPDDDINLHVFSAGCEETDRMLAFRDWLRSNRADRDLYAQTKRDLASGGWKYIQQYADAKTAVIGEIMNRALADKHSTQTEA